MWRWTSDDRRVWNHVLECATAVRQLLAEDAQTQESIHTLLQLITVVSKHARSTVRARLIVARAAGLVDRFLTSVGVSKHRQQMQSESRAAAIAQAAVDIRSKVKEFGLGLPNPHRQQCLGLVDWARDEALAGAGVMLKDGPNKTTAWRWKD